jgi:acyl-CoA hydrolase
MLQTAFQRFLRPNRTALPFKGFMPIPGRSPVFFKTAAEAVQPIKSNSTVWVEDIPASPYPLMKALGERAPELENVRIVGGFIVYNERRDPFNVDDDAHRRAFRFTVHFASGQTRHAYAKNYPHARFIPLSLSDIGPLLHSFEKQIDYALLCTSPPDKHGWLSTGACPIASMKAVSASRTVIAEINKKMPRTHGNTNVHLSHVDYAFESDRELTIVPPTKLGKVTEQIGKNIAALVPDGACLQAGVGALPDATLVALKNHKDLGVHAEMVGDGVVNLLEAGVITGKYKVLNKGRLAASFALGTRRIYNLIDDNPLFHFDATDYINDPAIIRQNPKQVAINAALEVDIVGQVSADTINGRQFSGAGGQIDFVMGASQSEGGRAIIAIPATASGDKFSRIVPKLVAGASVTTARWFGVTVVTEYGHAELWGLSTRERASALIKIAHPKFREELEKQAAEMVGYE